MGRYTAITLLSSRVVKIKIIYILTFDPCVKYMDMVINSSSLTKTHQRLRELILNNFVTQFEITIMRDFPADGPS